MLPHSDVVLTACKSVCICTHTQHTHAQCMQISSNTTQEGGLPKESSSLTEQFWDKMDKILNCQCLLVELKLIERCSRHRVQLMRSDCSGAAVSKGQMMEQRSKQSSVGHMTYKG